VVLILLTWFPLPQVGILFWCIHAFLTVSGAGPHWARWGARWGCLALVPLAWVALLVWAHYFLPPMTDTHIYSYGAPGRAEALWSLFLSPVAWITFVMLEPLLMRLGTRRERRKHPEPPPPVTRYTNPRYMK